jgi:hypothetical protein
MTPIKRFRPQSRPNIQCAYCGNEFQPKRRGTIYCCYEHAQKARYYAVRPARAYRIRRSWALESPPPGIDIDALNFRLQALNRPVSAETKTRYKEWWYLQ